MLARTHVTDWLAGTSRTGRFIVAFALAALFSWLAQLFGGVRPGCAVADDDEAGGISAQFGLLVGWSS